MLDVFARRGTNEHMTILWQAVRKRRAPGETHGLAVHGFLRGLGLIYLLAFWSLAAQAGGLFGVGGLSPIAETVAGMRDASRLGSLWALGWFALSSNMAMVWSVLLLGVGGGLLLLAGLFPWVGGVLAWSAWVSLRSVAGEWMGFQGDALLAEVGFVALWMAAPHWRRLPDPGEMPDRLLGLLMCHVLLVKVVLSSALVKLAGGDPFWARETALHVFFETQALPTAPAWGFHQFPGVLLRHAAVGVVLLETILPIYVFFPRTYRQLAAGGLSLLMLLLMFTGNHGHYPWLVLLLSFTLVDDRAWRSWLPEKLGFSAKELSGQPKSPTVGGWVVLCGWSFLCMGGIFWRAPEAFPVPIRPVVEVLDQVSLAQTYGMGGALRPHRFEIEVQGSVDGQQWREYLFRFKPGHPQRLPWIAGLHFPRLDFRVAELGWEAGRPDAFISDPWLANLAGGLMRNDPNVVRLFEVNPFADHPPAYIRFVVYEVRYADPVTRRDRGVWWVRAVRGLHGPVFRR